MRNSIFFAFSMTALLVGCDKEMPPMDEVEPVKPAMAGTQIERMGRPTINVAVTNPFNLNQTTIGGGANTDATRDKHSKDGNQAQWVATWTPILAQTLAIYDGADDICGDQFASCAVAGGCLSITPTPPAPAAGRYNTLASVLADDQLYVNTTKTNCSFYLAVEAAFLNVAGANMLCGGRDPLVDAVDETYTAAAVGARGFPVPPATAFAVTDGVLKDNEVMDSLTVFPFLSDPN